MFLAAKNVTDTGNSPPELTGLLTIFRRVGSAAYELDALKDPLEIPKVRARRDNLWNHELVPKLLPTRPVPLVNLSPHPPSLLNPHDREEDDDAWKWFGPSTPSHVKIYTPQPAPRPVLVQTWNAHAWIPQISLQKERKDERLVDVDVDEGGRLGRGMGFEPLDSSKTLVEFELSSYHADLKEKAYHHEDELLVDIRPTSPTPTLAPAPAKGGMHLVDSSPVAGAVGLIPGDWCLPLIS
ncbi:hypothetical protein NLJ89_g12114 [Agrocybe chaxingu]|uniref:Uncharacterized protein n=1 Tax=Agrocybe chaxingu TaxID=84603 RepID=A0A9W8MQZ0_9AGAR|nr:hypothetical protein NLJ89_g12114 [Agrocybe chaxingu]